MRINARIRADQRQPNASVRAAVSGMKMTAAKPPRNVSRPSADPRFSSNHAAIAVNAGL
jgi:hypothetical protein